MREVFFAIILIIMAELPATAAPINSSDTWRIDASIFNSISSAKQSPSTSGKTIIISTQMNCNNLTIPSDRAIEFKNGGNISVANGKTLVINGPVSGGQYQVFSGRGAITINTDSVNPNGWFAEGQVVTFNAGLNAGPSLISSAMVLGPNVRVNTVYPQWYATNTSPGTTDMSSAFNKAWAAIKSRGGVLTVPPNKYLLNTTWLMDVDQKFPYNYEIMGYGAELFAGPAVTGHSIQVLKGYNNFGVKIEGFHFNHRGNNTVNGCIQLLGAANARIVKCSVEFHNTKAGYSAIDLGPYISGDGNTSAFWTLIDGFTTRLRSGTDKTKAAVGIQIRESANATKILNCSFGGLVNAVSLGVPGYAGSGNGVVIMHNDFEGVTNAISINTKAPETYMPTGLRVAFNRVESTTTFINIVGNAVLNHSHPPIVENNYISVGSVANYLVNPNKQIIFSHEPSYYGLSRNYVGGPGDYTIITESAGHNLHVQSLDGQSDYLRGHLVLGEYHFWVDNSTGKFRMKSGPPVSASDGWVVGTQTQ